MDDLIRRQDAIDVADRADCTELAIEDVKKVTDEVIKELKQLPSAYPEPTLYGYPIEHLEMIARVMAKENCTPEIVAQMLQNVGEIAKMVRDEMMEMLKESIERSCKGVAND